ncbi:MAG: hypothetical protein AB1414_14570 [bacterium]
MPIVISDRLKEKFGSPVIEDFVKVMEQIILEKGVPKDELGHKLSVIDFRLNKLDEGYSEIKKALGELNERIDKIHERMERMEGRFNERMERMEGRFNEQIQEVYRLLISQTKLIVSQTKWMVGSIICVGTLISALMAIFRFVR